MRRLVDKKDRLHVFQSVRMFDSIDFTNSGSVVMADKSAIEWTEATWNPTTGCDRISAGCDNCYALDLAKRLKAMGSAEVPERRRPAHLRPRLRRHHPPRRAEHPATAGVNRGWCSSTRCPTCSTPACRWTSSRQVFDVMADTPQHTYQVLTKRSSGWQELADQARLAGERVDGRQRRDSEGLARVRRPAARRRRQCGSSPASRCSVRSTASTWTDPLGDRRRRVRPRRPPDGSCVGARPPEPVR